MPRLTKSRFTLALSCPTKLAYAGDSRYVDCDQKDEFLAALAEGGFQVGALAKLMFPGGVEVIERDQAAQEARTRELLDVDGSVIFEGTLVHGNWLARADILRRRGRVIELIEVKAKSFDSREGDPEIAWRSGRDGAIRGGYLPYLRDLAFQTLVLRSAYPDFNVRPFLLLPNKAKAATVDGLNRSFRIQRETGADGRVRAAAAPALGVTVATIGASPLAMIDAAAFVEEILGDDLRFPGGAGRFEDVARDWAAAYTSGQRIAPVTGAHCRSCQFRADAPPAGKRSGFHECWSLAPIGVGGEPSAPRPIVDLYSPARNQIETLIARGKRSFADLKDEDLPAETSDEGLTRGQRRRMQVFGVDDRRGHHFDAARWRAEREAFRWPLSFIDFEGARVALPFTRGRRPYQQVAFQFSHHVMERDGRVRHAGEFLDLTPGNDPTLAFLRALRSALEDPAAAGGTVFRWHDYENTVLNELRRDLLEWQDGGTAPPDAPDLLAFIDSLTVRRKDDYRGERAMVDLCKVADRLFFHPATQGRSSIKVLLPAVLQSSEVLRLRYSRPIYGAPGGIPSLNFPVEPGAGMTWWQPDATGIPRNPYNLLPPVFEDLPADVLEGFGGALDDDIAEGGAAMTAYARMQFSDVPDAVRESTRRALLRYCELDTLAMVMVFEAWQGWAD